MLRTVTGLLATLAALLLIAAAAAFAGTSTPYSPAARVVAVADANPGLSLG